MLDTFWKTTLSLNLILSTHLKSKGASVHQGANNLRPR